MHDLGDIWNEHAAEALRVCRAYVGRDSADDALGRVSLAAHSSFMRGGGAVENPRAWLLTIARHVCFDIYRERDRAAVECVPDETLERAAGRNAVRLEYGNPEKQYLARERLRRMASALESLAPELRQPLQALADGESDYEALARTFGITPEALRKRMQRARTLLRKRLNQGESAWTIASTITKH